VIVARRTLWTITGALALVATNCGPNQQAGGRDACRPDALARATEPVEVTLWHTLPAVRGGRASAPFADMVDAFNRSQGKVKVKVEAFTSGPEMERRFFSLPPDDRELPDLVELWWGANRAAIDSGRVVAAQACVDATGLELSDFVPQTLAVTRVEGRQWGLPIGHFGHVLFYDKGAFARAGLDSERPPATLAELRRAAEALKAAGVAHPLASRLVHPLFWTSTASANNQDGHSGRATEVTFASEETRRIARWAKAMFDDQLVRPPQSDGQPFDDLLALGRGESAMTIGLSWDLKDIGRALRQGQAPPGFRLGVAPLPTLDGPGVSLANASSLFLGSASSRERRAAAWSFLEWFESPAQQARWHETSFFFPTRRSAAAEPAVIALWAREPELAAGWSAATNAGPEWLQGTLVGASRKIEEEFDRALEDFFDRGRPLDEALDQAEGRANRVLTDYNADVAGYVRCHYAGSGCP
jgi:sn-glycerol 3-phosphate transport system substrate-binding protein